MARKSLKNPKKSYIRKKKKKILLKNKKILFWTLLKSHRSLQFFRQKLVNILQKLGNISAKHLTKIWDWNAVRRSVLCRSRRELSNDYLLAKFGFDTEENEPSKVWSFSLKDTESYSDFSVKSQTLEGSFSSVSRPIFATKYSFFSILRDLQDLHTFAPLQIQNVRKNSSNFFIFLFGFLQKFWIWSGANVWQHCRSRKML